MIQSALKGRRLSGDQIAIAYSLFDLGKLYQMRGHYGKAENYIMESLEISERIGVLDTIGRCFNGLSVLERTRKNYDEAEKALEQSLTIYRKINSIDFVPLTLNGLAAVVLAQGEQQKASEYLEESLDLAAGFKNVGDQATALNLMGNLAAANSQVKKAIEHYRQALKITQETGALPLTLEIFTVVASLELSNPEPNVGRAAKLLRLVQVHPAATQETREKAERMIIAGGLEYEKSNLEDVEMYIADIIEE